MQVSDFLTLCEKSEGPQFDFKSQLYDFSGEDKKEKDRKRACFVKDILSMANTPRETPSYIVIGVKEHSNGSKTFLGISEHIDDAQLQEKLKNWTHPHPQFTYKTVQYENKTYGIISIDPYREAGPFFYRNSKDIGKILKNNVLYFRRGSQNDIAESEDQKAIYKWFLGESENVITDQIYHTSEWENFTNSVDNFDKRRTFLLATPPLDKDLANESLPYLGHIDWTFVADFDHESLHCGALETLLNDFQERRVLHKVTFDDDITFSTNSTYWFFARGIQGRDSTIAIGKWIDWKKNISNIFETT